MSISLFMQFKKLETRETGFSPLTKINFSQSKYLLKYRTGINLYKTATR